MTKLVIGRNPKFWDTNEDVIFINDWSAISELANKKLNIKHKVADFSAESPFEILEIISRSRMFEDSILPRLCDELNAYHQVNRSLRFWKTLIGAWLRRVIEMYFFRKYHLLRCVEKYQITSIRVLSDANLVEPTFLTIDFLHLRNNTEWDARITSKIVQSLNLLDVDLEVIHSRNDSEILIGQSLQEKVQFAPEIKPKRLLVRYLSKMQRRNDAFIRSTYLSRRHEVLLNLSFGQFPQIYKFEELLEPVRSQGYNRCQMSDNLSQSYSLADEQFLVNLIVDLFPSCYLEDMPELQEAINFVRFPENPKFIFTSNDFDTNEIFKLWAALQVEKGIPYYIGQHGNNYGVNRFLSPSVEESVCDAFLTWGWSRDLEREVACFNFKQPKRKKRKKKQSSLVLFELPLENDNLTWSGIHKFENYMQEQFSFVENLSESIRNELIIRLYQPKAFPAGQEIIRWKDFDSRVKLDLESSSNSLLAKTKLAIFSYDSTGILERLSLNLPVIAFWENKYMHVSEEFTGFYEELESVGILHPSALNASNFINQHWDDLDAWWSSDVVQAAVSKFCRNFSRHSTFPVLQLNKTLRELLLK